MLWLHKALLINLPGELPYWVRLEHSKCMSIVTMPVSTFFEDFDAKPVFDRFRDAVRSPHSSNFILDFNGKSAQCAFDLDASAVKEAVQERASRSEVYDTCLLSITILFG